LGVFMAYASAHGHALIDRELYLPQSWTDDPDRCRQAGIPQEAQFASKPRLAQAMISRALLHHARRGAASRCAGRRPAATVLAKISAGAGAGAHGPREYHWARVRVHAGAQRGRGRWLLARRSVRDPEEISYYACSGPSRSSTR
jgi:DDE superfamily endonuclease